MGHPQFEGVVNATPSNMEPVEVREVERTVHSGDEMQEIFELFEKEREEILSQEKNIIEIIRNTNEGKIIKIFGASQIYLDKNIIEDNPIGVVVLKSYIDKKEKRKQINAFDTISSERRSLKETLEEISREEVVIDSFYEIWGIYDHGESKKIGPLLYFKPEMVKHIINLRSGFEQPVL